MYACNVNGKKEEKEKKKKDGNETWITRLYLFTQIKGPVLSTVPMSLAEQGYKLGLFRECTLKEADSS